MRRWRCVTDFREGFKKKKIEEESDAGGAGFKAQAAHWLTAVHWRDGEGERQRGGEGGGGGGGGVERVSGVNGDGEAERGLVSSPCARMIRG